MIQLTSFVCLIFAGIYVDYVQGGNFPRDKLRCPAGDVICLKTVINQYIRESARGIPSIHLAPIDPLSVSEINIIQGGAVNLKLNLKNSNFIGFSNVDVTKVVGFEKNPRKSKFEIYCRIPRLAIIGNYKINGRVIILPIVGNGPANMTFDNVFASVKYETRVEIKEGKEYLRINKVKVEFTTTRFYMNFENLFNGDRALGPSTNLFLNENWVAILNDMKPVISNKIGEILRNVVDTVFATYPYADFFQENRIK